MTKIIITVLIILLILPSACPQRQIDTFNILFPEIKSEKSGHPVQLITAEGGCFQWISSQPSVVNVKGLPSDNSNCLKRGLIELGHIGKYSASIYISTMNAQTQQLSNIPVRIKPIKNIQIIAKSRIMNRGQRQDLSIYAYDADLNKFTSLEGLKFKWEILLNPEKQPIISKISLTNSHLIMQLDERKSIQKIGAESDIIVIKGQNPGKAQIKVICLEPGYENITHQIFISVTQRFDIKPTLPTYLLADSKFDFKLIKPTQQQIELPQRHYKIFVKKQFKVSNTLQMITPDKQTETLLRVQDTRTSPGYSSEVQVYSKMADKLILKTQQYLVVGQKAKVQIEFYWQHHLLKGVTDKIQIQTTLNYEKDTKIIFADKKTVNIVKAIYKNLSAEKKVHTVLPLKVVLPSDEIILPLEETFELKIIGGSGLYEYQIKDDTLASISGSGIISTKKQGRTTIKVFDKKTSNNKIVLTLIVTPLDFIIPLETQKQLNKNQYGSIFTLGQTKETKYYTKCSQQPIFLEIGHLAQFQQNKNSLISLSLRNLKKKATESPLLAENIKSLSLLKSNIKEFVNKFNIYIQGGDISSQQLHKYAEQLQNYGICSAHSIKSYQKHDGFLDVFYGKNKLVKNKFHLRVYEPISSAVEAKQNQSRFIMTPLSSLQWQTKGGSYQWQQATKVILNSTQSTNKFPKIQCPAYQTIFQTTILYINKQSKYLLLPVNQTTTIIVQCKYPASLKIKYEKYNANQHIIKGLKGEVIKGELISLTSKKQTFYNSSNLIYSSQKTHGELNMIQNRFEYTPQSIEKATKVIFWTESIKSLKERFIRASTYFEYVAKDLFSIENYPVSKHLLMLFNPKGIYSLNIRKISDNTQISCNGSVTCIYLQHNKTKSIHINTTRIGQGYLSAKDNNIYGAPMLEIFFQVIDADQIKLKIEKKQIEVNNQTIAEVELLYKYKLIPSWQYEPKHLLLVHESGIRSQLIPQTLNKFLIKGDKTGNYHISAQKNFPSHLQSSSSLPITVYSKITTNIQSLPSVYIDNVLHYSGQIMIAANCFRLINILDGPLNTRTTSKVQNQKIIELSKIGQNFRNYKIEGKQKGNSKITFTVYSATENVALVIVELNVIIKQIQLVVIYSLNEALINAQFRVISHLIIDGMVLLDSVCDLEYEWKTSSNINIKSIKNRAGVNATAVRQGDGLIELKVVNSQGQIILTNKKSIKVHKSLDLELPTIIGDDSKKQSSSNLLLPPNSGYSFDSNIHLTKISLCDEGTLTIKQNRLITSREKGVVAIQLQKHNDESYNNFLNVIITDIKALFMQNQYSQVTADLGSIKKIRFYIQDIYGRLFYNNIQNVQFDIISSNEQIFVASIDNSKQFINIYPKKRGKATLILKLRSSSSTNKLLQIPHDIVIVEVGRVIQPLSPIQIAVGGFVELQYHGKSTQNWQILSGSDLIDIYPTMMKIVAKKSGQASVLIGQYTIIVKVVDVKLKYKWVQKAQPGFNKAIAEFILNQKVEGSTSLVHSMQNTYNFINNNMKISCEPIRKTWFKVSSFIQKDSQGFDKLICEFTKNDIFDVVDEIPIKLEWNVVNKKDGKIIVLQTFQVPIQPTFWIPHEYKTSVISYSEPSINILIKSLAPLKTQVINGKREWVKQWRSDFNQVQILHIQLDPRGLNQNFDFTINLENQLTGQSDHLTIKFVMDSSKREQIQSNQNKKQTQIISEDKSGFQIRWHWTDFLILLMALNFIALMLWQYCTSNQNNKYKQL